MAAAAMSVGLVHAGASVDLVTSYPAKGHIFLVAGWVAPPEPDPMEILNEARDDADAGRYVDALDKQLWIHHKSLQYSPPFSGVRLSFALAQWKELGRRYPPALDALKQVRDEAVVRVRSGSRPWEAFHDVSSIDAALGEEAATSGLFAWLDANRPEVAKRVYMIAQNALVATRSYALCGKYLEPIAETDRIIGMHRMTRRMDKGDGKLATFSQRSFGNRAAMLVALLAVNGMQAEADAAAQEFLKEWPDDSFRAQMNEAAKGVVPEPWPRFGS